MLQYRAVGPPLEIKLLSGELEEVHLPHSLCLGGSGLGVLGDAVRALHGDDCGVSLETCELTRFHGKLLAQQFSIWQLVASLGVPVKSHCEVLIYEHCPRPLVLHTFLLPSPSSARKSVQESWGGRAIVKPSPNHSLWTGSTFQLCSSTACNSTPSSSAPSSSTPSSSAAPNIPPSLKITPTELTLSYRNPPTFFEVFVRNPLEEFKLEIKDADDHTVWEVELRQGVDYNKTKDTADTHTPESRTATSDLTDQQLMMVAKLMGKEWKQVGISYLGLSMQELDKIQEAEQDVTLQRFRMLDHWKRQQKGKAGPTELHRCLNEEDVPNAVRDCLEGK
ncbi:uncharacterized protein LOC134453940 [Engraulis encrasicolus]|uniref:uncharacterized protein LOC134453940 n=1 Tax=Engraulis encrasicolus TaxID=184585 RepID=UPI002FCE99EA